MDAGCTETRGVAPCWYVTPLRGSWRRFMCANQEIGVPCSRIGVGFGIGVDSVVSLFRLCIGGRRAMRGSCSEGSEQGRCRGMRSDWGFAVGGLNDGEGGGPTGAPRQGRGGVTDECTKNKLQALCSKGFHLEKRGGEVGRHAGCGGPGATGADHGVARPRRSDRLVALGGACWCCCCWPARGSEALRQGSQTVSVW